MTTLQFFNSFSTERPTFYGQSISQNNIEYTGPYTKENPLTFFEAFSGIGATHAALNRICEKYPKFAVKSVGYSEIDSDCSYAYQALHGQDISNYGDITEINWTNFTNPDLFSVTSPCQDISLTGKQQGFDENSATRSSLLWECKTPITLYHPTYILLENVKNMVSKKFMPEFQRWIDFLSDQGYTSYWDVLKASDYGVPQARERLFMVSILGEHTPFEFPEPVHESKCPEIYLENDVDTSYYFGSESQQGPKDFKVVEQILTPTCVDGNCPTLKASTKGTTQWYYMVTTGFFPGAGVIEVCESDKPLKTDAECQMIYDALTYDYTVSLDSVPENLHRFYHRTISNGSKERIKYVVNNLKKNQFIRVRRLTEVEYLRLMDFSDTDISKMKEANISNSKLYHMAGNSIVVEPLARIFENLFIKNCKN